MDGTVSVVRDRLEVLCDLGLAAFERKNQIIKYDSSILSGFEMTMICFKISSLDLTWCFDMCHITRRFLQESVSSPNSMI